MPTRKPAHDFLADEDHKQCVDAIIAHFQDEHDKEIGILAAEDLLDLIQEHITKAAYNRGIDDTTKLIQTKLADMQVEIDLLKRQ